MKKYGDMNVNKYREMHDNRIIKGIRVIRREGLLSFVGRTSHYFLRASLSFVSPLAIRIIPKVIPKRHFTYNGKKLPYLYHKKSLAWTNERTVEVPIVTDHIREFAQKMPDEKILEVGAVLPHYFPEIRSDVLDKFEKSQGTINIINGDVIDFRPNQKYKLIVSISTLEHVGFDDDVKDPEGILKALENLKNNCLEENGEILVTLPIGYNTDVDRYIFNNNLDLREETYLKRTGILNKWREISKEEAKRSKYPGFSAQTIIVGLIRKSSGTKYSI